MVLARGGGRYRVRTDDGSDVEASLRGRMKRGEERVLVGDRVRLAVHGASATVEEVLPRASVLQRRSPGRGRGGGTRQVAANLDQVIVVGAADQPPWDPQLMDRFLAVGEANDLPVHLVINKIALVDSAEPAAAPYRRAGYEVLCTSARTGAGVEGLRDLVTGRVSLFTGPTGVGKSSLGNALEPGLDLRTRTVSGVSRTGRHTTVTAEMHPLATGGYLVDTPGLSDIGLWGLAPHEVVPAFPEIAALAPHCRFDDCRHGTEPDCAVQAALAAATLARTRYDSFRRLLAEAEEASRWWA